MASSPRNGQWLLPFLRVGGALAWLMGPCYLFDGYMAEVGGGDYYGRPIDGACGTGLAYLLWCYIAGSITFAFA